VKYKTIDRRGAETQRAEEYIFYVSAPTRVKKLIRQEIVFSSFRQLRCRKEEKDFLETASPLANLQQ
jgi:hypothetical protein